MKLSLLKAFCHKNRRPLLGLSLLELLSALLILPACYLMTQVIGGVFLQGWNLPTAAPDLLVLLFVLSARELLTPVSSRIRRGLSGSLRASVRHDLHASMLHASPDTTVAASQRCLTLALETTDALDDALTKVLPNILSLVLRTPLLLVALFVVDWPTGGLALLTLPIAPFLLYLIGTVTKDRSRKAWQTLRELSAGFGELVQAIPVVKLFHRTENQRQRLSEISADFARSSLHVLQLAFLSSFALELITTLAIALIAVGVGLRLLYGHLDFASAFFVLLLTPEFYAPLREAGSGFHAGMTAYTAWQGLAPFLSVPNAPQASGRHASLRVPPAIHLDSIRYRYPSSDADALASLTLTIAAGKITAITGPSGCGKSTLVRLLAGLAQPTAGSICFGDQALTTMAPESRHKLIAFVPQEPHLYNATLRENLTLSFSDTSSDLSSHAFSSRPSRSDMDSPYHTVLQQAGLSSWYQSLPDGLATRLGERGITLSNGQRHRLGLARALLQGRPILLLDEPTAGLDAKTEQLVLHTLQDFSRHRTVILVTHRPAALAIADHTITLAPPQSAAKSAPSGLHPASQSLNRSKLSDSGYLPSSHPDDAASDASSHPHAQDAAPPSLLAYLAPASFLVLLLVSLLSMTTGIGLLGAAAWLIASAALHPPLYALTLGITAVRACGIGRAAFRYGERYLTHRTAFSIQTQLHLRLYDHAARLLPLRRGPARQGELLHRLLTGTATLRDFYLRGLLPPLTTGIFTLIGTVVLWPYLSFPAILLPLCWLIHLIPLATVHPAAAHTQARQAALYRSTILDFLTGGDELRTAGCAHRAVSCLDFRAQSWQSLLCRQEQQRDLHDMAISLTNPFTLILLTALLIPSVTNGSMTGITLAVFLLLLESLLAEYRALPASARQAREAISTARQLFATSDSDERISSHEGLAAMPPDSSRLDAAPGTSSLLSVHGLSFGYDASHPVLQDLSFTVLPGQHTAIIGESGAGKTTLANLLAGVWPPDAGTITCTCPMTVLPQGSHLFSASIRTNFTYLYPGMPDKKIRAALQDAQLASLPIDAYLGENASHLSGGQRTRLITALTIASDAPLLLLDEPTNGLDAAATDALLAALFARAASTGQTFLIITHDPKPLAYCHQTIRFPYII